MSTTPIATAHDLLQEKNSLLDSFLTLTLEELVKVRSRNFDSLEKFYKQRDKILHLIKTITEHYESAASDPRTAAIKCPLEEGHTTGLKSEGDEIISRILEADLEMISLIDHEKNMVIREYQSVASNRKVLKAYRSGL